MDEIIPMDDLKKIVIIIKSINGRVHPKGWAKNYKVHKWMGASQGIFFLIIIIIKSISG